MTTDPILLWNAVALEANRVSHTNGQNEEVGPPRSARALAIVHLAMYDAYAATDAAANLAPYLPNLPASPAGASSDAAVSAAAHRALTRLFPSQAASFNFVLAASGNTSDAGHAFGIAVADAIIQDRASDPGVSNAGYVTSPQRGHHRADPDDPSETPHAPFYGAQARGFAVRQRYPLDPPPFDDNEYRAALREVRGKGIKPELLATLQGVPGVTARRMDETVAGIYWAYDGARELGTPPRLYNQVVRRLAIARQNTPAQNARLFALVNVAMADAGILAWEEKYRYDLWRPVLGIREHDLSTGPLTPNPTQNLDNIGDPFWLPLGAPHTNATLPPTNRATPNNNLIVLDTNPTVGNEANVMGRDTTPNFPAYPSGHATFGAAAFHITRLFYGVPPGDRADDSVFVDDQGASLNFVSDELNGVNRDSRGAVRPRHARSFNDGLWGMIVENGRSRVFLGVHWVFDAFAVLPGQTEGNAQDGKEPKPDLSRNIGGVPLGLNIAEDIFAASTTPGWGSGGALPT